MKPLSLVLVALFAQSVFATTPTPLPTQLPPLQLATPPTHVTRPVAGPPIRNWTRAVIESAGLSSTVRRDFLTHLLPFTQNQTATTAGSSDTTGAARYHLRAKTETTAQSTAQASNDTLEDIEPAIITNRYNNVDRTTSVFTKFDASNTPFHYWTSTTDFVNFVGAPTGQQLPLPTGTTRSGDPMLSENPYLTGAFPKRTYCGGTSYTLSGGQFAYSALTVWYNDDPGTYAWTTMVIDSANNPIFLDKPSVATSWHTGTLGYTYVAAIANHLDNHYHTIQLYRQTTAEGFTLVNTQFTGLGLQSPIVTVDTNTGDVYLLWVDWTNNVVEIARSTDMGNTFSTPVAFGTGTLLTDSGTITDSVRAASAIMARINAPDNSIGVVWHQREADNVHTDVGFNQFSLATQSWHWWRGIQVGHVGSNDGLDQWNAALDPASDGSYMVTWYDRRDDPSDNLYRVYAEKVHADGTAIDAADTPVYNTAAGADPRLLPLVGNGRYIGDYQDIWEWFGTWYGSTIYIAGNGNEDVYITRITP